VGGDYYDYFWMDEEKTQFGIAMADVTGKAMKASIIAVMTSGMIHSEINSHRTPGRILGNINKPMFRKTDRNFFTTMIFAVLDVKEKTSTIASAGHNYPLLLREGKVEYLETTKQGLPLGVNESIIYGEEVLTLQKGDTMLLYTDGLTEAETPEGELYGFDRTEALLKDVEGKSSKEILDSIMEKIDRFQGSAEQHDDITLVAIRVTE
jgi:sigma-B regulation protein RsbU (phosphoserine phosphatase)